MLDALPNTTAYTLITRDRAAWEGRFVAQKTTSRDITRFQESVANITSPEALLKDYRTLKFVLTAFGMEGEIGKTAVLRKLMTEDPTDPKSFANRMTDPRYRAFANAMSEWMPPEPVRARTLETIASFYQLANLPAPASDTAAFKSRAAQIDSPAAVVADRDFANDTLSAFGIDPATISDDTLTRLLTEDPESWNSFAAGQTDTKLRAYARTMAMWLPNPGVTARVINGMADAAPTESALALGTDNIVAAYTARFPNASTRDVANLRMLAERATSADDILNNRELADYTLRAMGLNPSDVNDDTLRRLLTEDPSASSSYAAGQDDAAYVTYARTIANWVGNSALQSRFASGIVDRWTTNAFEIDQEGSGVRAALYFRRVAGSIDSINALMSDKVLMEVVRGAYGLGDKFGLMEFEQQRRVLTQRVDLEDLRDPKAVDRLAQRYLIGKQETAATSPLLAVFNNSGSVNNVVTLGLLLRTRA